MLLEYNKQNIPRQTPSLPEQKFQIGDKVVMNKFKTDAIGFIKDMEPYTGKTGVITDAIIFPKGTLGYRVKSWWWPENALTLVEE